jgi:hypothetical protein
MNNGFGFKIVSFRVKVVEVRNDILLPLQHSFLTHYPLRFELPRRSTVNGFVFSFTRRSRRFRSLKGISMSASRVFWHMINMAFFISEINTPTRARRLDYYIRTQRWKYVDGCGC